MTGDQHRPPVPRSDSTDIVVGDELGIGSRLAMEQTVQLVEIKMRGQQVLATEIDDGLMLLAAT